MKPDLVELKIVAEGYSIVPVYRTLPLGNRSTMDILHSLKRRSHKLFVLENTDFDDAGATHWSRYAYLGCAPSFEVSCINKEIVFATEQSSFSFYAENPIDCLRSIIAENKAPVITGLPQFCGGLAGYFSYEYIQQVQPSCLFCAGNKENYRDFDLMFFDRLYVLDREKEVIYLICHIKTDDLENNYKEAAGILREMEQILLEQDGDAGKPLQLQGDFSLIYEKSAYIEHVKKARDLIRQGEVAQIVLTNGKKAKAEGNLLGVFEHIRKTDPTRYMCYFSSDDMEAAMASPEPIAKISDGIVMTERLAGSYARGATAAEDAQQAQALRQDAKAIDEHNMLVDDSRNEFGYICKIGSIKLDGYLNVFRCAKVMHLGTTVTGELKDGIDALDVINAITPSGAVSGAPKIRSCEVINEIEQERRGIYGASFGYIGLDGNADIFTFIHSAFLKNGELVVRTGGGIVIDSVPEDEFEECLFKAEAMLGTIKLATEGKK